MAYVDTALLIAIVFLEIGGMIRDRRDARRQLEQLEILRGMKAAAEDAADELATMNERAEDEHEL